MTRKDYVALAEALRLVEGYAGLLTGAEVWNRCRENVANVCAKDNPHFDRARFLKACAVPMHYGAPVRGER